jgi:hypothetical protein
MKASPIFKANSFIHIQGCISKLRIDDYPTLPSPKERGHRIILKCTHTKYNDLTKNRIFMKINKLHSIGKADRPFCHEESLFFALFPTAMPFGANLQIDGRCRIDEE